jgi:hypothetical protein
VRSEVKRNVASVEWVGESGPLSIVVSGVLSSNVSTSSGGPSVTFSRLCGRTGSGNRISAREFEPAWDFTFKAESRPKLFSSATAARDPRDVALFVRRLASIAGNASPHL